MTIWVVQLRTRWDEEDALEIFQKEEIPLIISQLQVHFLQKVEEVVGQIFSGTKAQVDERINDLVDSWIKKAYQQEMPDITSQTEIVEVIEEYNPQILQIIYEAGRKYDRGGDTPLISIESTVVWEAFAKVVLEIIENNSTGLKNIRKRWNFLRLKVIHKGAVKTQTVPIENLDVPAQSIKDVLKSRESLISQRDRANDLEKRKKKLEKEKWEAIETLLKAWIIERIEVTRTKKRVTRTIENWINTVEEAIVEDVEQVLRVCHLKIYNNYDDSWTHFRFDKWINGRKISFKRSIPEHNGRTYTTIVNKIISAYKKEFWIHFSIWEQTILLSLWEKRWKYENINETRVVPTKDGSESITTKAKVLSLDEA